MGEKYRNNYHCSGRNIANVDEKKIVKSINSGQMEAQSEKKTHFFFLGRMKKKPHQFSERLAPLAIMGTPLRVLLSALMVLWWSEGFQGCPQLGIHMIFFSPDWCVFFSSLDGGDKNSQIFEQKNHSENFWVCHSKRTRVEIFRFFHSNWNFPFFVSIQIETFRFCVHSNWAEIYHACNFLLIMNQTVFRIKKKLFKKNFLKKGQRCCYIFRWNFLYKKGPFVALLKRGVVSQHL